MDSSTDFTPTWKDVYEVMSYFEKQYGGTVDVTIQPGVGEAQHQLLLVLHASCTVGAFGFKMFVPALLEGAQENLRELPILVDSLLNELLNKIDTLAHTAKKPETN